MMRFRVRCQMTGHQCKEFTRQGERLLMINTGHSRVAELQFFSGQFYKERSILELRGLQREFHHQQSDTSFLFFICPNLSISFVCDVDVADQTFFLFFSLLAFNYPLSDINCQFVKKFHNFLEDLNSATDRLFYPLKHGFIVFQFQNTQAWPTWPAGH